jgi:hypothetical protein
MRLRFRLRTLMILVAMVAVGLFAVRTRQTWHNFGVEADFQATHESHLSPPGPAER